MAFKISLKKNPNSLLIIQDIEQKKNNILATLDGIEKEINDLHDDWQNKLII